MKCSATESFNNVSEKWIGLFPLHLFLLNICLTFSTQGFFCTGQMRKQQLFIIAVAQYFSSLEECKLFRMDGVGKMLSRVG